MKIEKLTHDPTLNYSWPKCKANLWYKQNGWIIGCNYIPATAINQLEMWQPESFEPFVIDKELSWAARVGFNTVRVFLHHLVWEQDPAGYLCRIDQFLSIATKHGIKTMLVLFDSVWDPNPKAGKQPDPFSKVHNSGWVQCPGFNILNNPHRYGEVSDYVYGIVNCFKNDKRVLLWDLFNEPDNMNLASYKDDGYSRPKAELALQLLKKVVSWVRTIEPSQPITMAPWQWTDLENLSEMDSYMFAHSDIISFHCYEAKVGMEQKILALKAFERPIVCSEYMARAFGCTFQNILPLLKEHNIGGLSWGFVEGKTQTFYPWNSWETNTKTDTEIWFHDIFRSNGEPYDLEELAYLINLNTREKVKNRCLSKMIIINLR